LDIADWLHGIALERYVETFRANAIEVGVLPDLTETDLEMLGVLLGHRKLMLRAIAALREPPQPVTDLAPGRADTAERRQLTVMFCDLVGSTPLAARYDPEDLRELIGAYHRCVADAVARFAGFVAKYMGDGVLVYFGYPEAHEDDAERAVRAGLAVIDAVGRLAAPEPLSVRLGIASGLVVVGDLIGAGAAQERGVVGETPNLAARLQAVAAPARWSSPTTPGGRSARCSRSMISGRSPWPALPSRSAPGASSARAALSVALRRCVRKRRLWSGATKSSICCCGAGSRRGPAKAE